MRIRFLLIIILLWINVCYSATTFQQTLTTTVPAAVNITAVNTALATGTINAAGGNSSSPAASFRLQTNGADSNYTYVVQAKLLTTTNTQTNAYAQIGAQGYILLGNNSPSNYPTAAAINNITGGNPTATNNANVIAYPITNALNNLSSITLTNLPAYGGLCYKVTTGNSKDGTLTQTLGSTPLLNTYSITNDRAGVYQAIVTLSANRNP